MDGLIFALGGGEGCKCHRRLKLIFRKFSTLFVNSLPQKLLVIWSRKRTSLEIGREFFKLATTFVLKSLIARLRVRAFKYIVIRNYGLCGSNYS